MYQEDEHQKKHEEHEKAERVTFRVAGQVKKEGAAAATAARGGGSWWFTMDRARRWV